jgi:hypothetical protein
MSYVFDNAIIRGDTGINVRPLVRAATVSSGTLATSFENGDTIDGVLLATGDRILIKNQASGIENGIYVVQATGAPIRAADLDTGDSANLINAFITEGTVNANTGWVCTSSPAVVGTDALTFQQFDVISALSAARGGTGVTSLTSGRVLVGNGTGAVDLTKVAPAGDFVGTTDIQTLTNKTLTTPTIDGATLSLDDTGSAFILNVTSNSSAALTADRTFTFDVNNADRTIDISGNITTAADFITSGANSLTFTTTGVTNVTLPTTGTVATLAGVETLSNKTLTTPVIAQINTANADEMIVFSDAGATAVNYLQISNSITANNPILTAVGDDADIGLDFQNKGTGVYRFLSTASVPAELRIFEDTDLGSNYVGIDVPNVTSSYTLTLPAAVGSSGQFVRLADNSGNLEFFTLGSQSLSFSVVSAAVSATSTSASTFAYFAFDTSTYGGFTTYQFILWTEDTTDRNLLFSVTDGTNTDTLTVVATTANGIQTLTLSTVTTVADARWALRANKNTAGGTSPMIYGIQLHIT